MNAQSGPNPYPTCAKCNRGTGANYYVITRVEGSNKSEASLCGLLCVMQWAQMMATFKVAQIGNGVRGAIGRLGELLRGSK